MLSPNLGLGLPRDLTPSLLQCMTTVVLNYGAFSIGGQAVLFSDFKTDSVPTHSRICTDKLVKY